MRTFVVEQPSPIMGAIGDYGEACGAAVAVTDPSIQLRSMIERIKLTPEEGALNGLRVELERDLAAILAAASEIDGSQTDEPRHGDGVHCIIGRSGARIVRKSSRKINV
jgi:hypothetical protein